MKRTLVASAAAVGALRAAGMGLGLLVTVILGRTLGPEGLGAYGYAVIILSLLGVPVSYGWGSLLLRRVASAMKDAGWGDAKGMMLRGTQYAAAIALAGGIAGMLLYWTSTQPASLSLTAAAALLLAAVLFFDQLSALRLAVLRGLDHPVWGQLPEMLLRPGLLIASFGAMYLLRGGAVRLEDAFAALAIGALGAAVAGVVVLRRMMPAPFAQAAARYHTRNWMASATLLAGNSGLLLLNSYTDTLLLGALGSLEQVGIYRIATQMSLLSGFVYTAINMLATPRFATLRAAGDTAMLQTTAVFMARLALLGALPLPLFFLLFGSSILRVAFGAPFEAAYAPMFVLFAGQVVNAAAGMARSQLMMSGHEDKLLGFSGIAVLVNAVASAVLIPRFGVMGAAAGNVLAMTVWNLCLWIGSVRLTGIDTSVIGRFGAARQAANAATPKTETGMRKPQDGMKYRREIDGLRALAVLPVILFHAGISAFSGGFVGVDVFFVISGYLITYIILDEQEQGKFSIARFYERRARRILPALFLVLAFCVPLAWRLLTPVDMQEFARSVVAVAAFSSNILFWQQSGYFDTASELKPLLHTWSLAVEEQFYVLFPLLLVFLWKFGRRAAYVALGSILVLSIALAEWGASRAPDATFYLLPTRAWELMLGALAAVFVSGRHDRGIDERHPGWAAGAALLGLGLITYSVFAFDKTLPFPGVYALVPTVGALLIILFARPHNVAGRILGSRWFVGIGLVSYSAYLWHQPLLAFARHASLDEPPMALLLAMCAASLALAYLSWRFVEMPFRGRQLLTRKSVFAVSAAGLALFAGFGVLGDASSGFRMRWGPEFARFQPEDKNFFRYVGCASNPKKFIAPEQACSYGQGEARIAVVGDSHARAIVYELAQAAQKRGMKVTQFTYEGCPPILDVYRADQGSNHRCYEHNKATFEYLARNPGLEYVVLVGRWPLYLEGARFDNGEGGVEKGLPTRLDLVVDGKRATTAEEARLAGIQQRMARTIGSYVAAGKKVIVVQSVPEAGWHVPEYLMKALSRRGALAPADGSTSFAVYERRSRHAAEVFSGLQDQKNVVLVQPARHLCNIFVPGRCVTHLESVPLYRDADHLSNLGVHLIVEDIMRAIPQNAIAAAHNLHTPAPTTATSPDGAFR